MNESNFNENSYADLFEIMPHIRKVPSVCETWVSMQNKEDLFQDEKKLMSFGEE